LSSHDVVRRARRNVEPLGAAAGQVEIVVEELPEYVNKVGQPLGIPNIQVFGGIARIGLIGERVADEASIGPRGPVGAANAIEISGRRNPEEADARLALIKIAQIVARPIDAAEIGRRDTPFERLEYRPEHPLPLLGPGNVPALAAVAFGGMVAEHRRNSFPQKEKKTRRPGRNLYVKSCRS